MPNYLLGNSKNVVVARRKVLKIFFHLELIIKFWHYYYEKRMLRFIIWMIFFQNSTIYIEIPQTFVNITCKTNKSKSKLKSSKGST